MTSHTLNPTAYMIIILICRPQFWLKSDIFFLLCYILLSLRYRWSFSNVRERVGPSSPSVYRGRCGTWNWMWFLSTMNMVSKTVTHLMSHVVKSVCHFKLMITTVKFPTHLITLTKFTTDQNRLEVLINCSLHIEVYACV